MQIFITDYRRKVAAVRSSYLDTIDKFCLFLNDPVKKYNCANESNLYYESEFLI